MASCFNNTYKLYKSYTEEICQYLIKVGKQCGYEIHGQQPPQPTVSKPPPKPQPRLKGKARKQAKQAEKTPQQLSGSGSGSGIVVNTKISIADIIGLAKAIAHHVSAPKTPAAIASKLIKTIALRRQYLESYAANPSLEKENAAHAYFLHVLIQVRDLLTPSDVAPAPSPATGGTHALDLKSLTNSFYLLDVEEINETDENQNDSPAKGPSSPSEQTDEIKATVVFERKEEREEMMFAIYCLFHDMCTLRGLIRKQWELYKQRRLQLETVAMISNLAIECVREMERALIEQFSAQLPSMPQYKDICDALLLPTAQARGIDLDKRELPSDHYNYELGDLGEWFGLATYHILTLTPLISWEELPAESYAPPKDRNTLTLRERIEQDWEYVAETFKDVCLLKKAGLQSRETDEFSKAIIDFYASEAPRKISVCMVFATQLFVDCRAVMGSQVQMALKDLQTAGRETKHSFEAYLTFTARLPSSERLPPHNTELVNWVLRYMIEDHILSDVLMDLKKRSYQAQAGTGQESMIFADCPERFKFQLLKVHPLLCGTMLFNLRMMTQDLGMNICSAWGFTMSAGHAYNALRQSSKLTVTWPAMDFLTSNFKLFVGDAPATFDACLNNFLLMTGHSPAIFAPNRRVGGNRASAKGPPDWTVCSPFVQVFKDVLQPDSTDKLEPNYMRRLLAKLTAIHEGYPRRQAAPVASSPAFILAMRSALEDAHSCLSFDYVKLHQVSMKLLRALRDALHARFCTLFGPVYMERAHELHELSFIAGRIFLTVGATQKMFKETTGRNMDPTVYRSSTIQTTTQVLENFIAQELL